MVAIPANRVAAFLAKPDPAVRAVLVYGQDAGLVGERAQALCAALAAREKPAGEIQRLDDHDFDNDPDRLAVELFTVPMFGGAKIVRVAASRRVNTNMLKALLTGPPLAGSLVVEGGNLRREDALRGLFEKTQGAAAIACYADEGATLDALVSEVLGAAKLAISPDARAELLSRLGADRALSRAEIEKLALFAAGAERIEVDHVEAAVGDVSAMAIDRILDAAAVGDAAAALSECDRALAAGESPQAVILLAQRHFLRLHRIRADMEGGRSLEDVFRQMRPQPHFRQRAALERQCRLWSLRLLTEALGRIAATAKAARLASAIEVAHAERLLLEIARLARQSQARGRARA